MLPQHLVYKNELNCEYVITLARNDETPWWWSVKIEICRSGFKGFKWKLYRCICWLIVEVILRNARSNDEISSVPVSKLLMLQFDISKYSTILVVNLFLRYKCGVPVPYEAFNRVVKFILTELARIFLSDALHVQLQLSNLLIPFSKLRDIVKRFWSTHLVTNFVQHTLDRPVYGCNRCHPADIKNAHFFSSRFGFGDFEHTQNKTTSLATNLSVQLSSWNGIQKFMNKWSAVGWEY